MLFINAQAPEVSKIAFGSGLHHPGTPLVRSEIYAMDEDGNDQLNITNDATGSDGSPDWSPDGTTIAFGLWGGADPDEQIWLMDTDGGNKRVLTEDGAGNLDWFDPNFLTAVSPGGKLGVT